MLCLSCGSRNVVIVYADSLFSVIPSVFIIDSAVLTFVSLVKCE